MTTGLLRCRVYKGMFSDELAIKYKNDDRVSAFFVPRDKVVGFDNESGNVVVQVFRKNGKAWAVLPTETQSVITIREADFVPQ